MPESAMIMIHETGPTIFARLRESLAFIYQHGIQMNRGGGGGTMFSANSNISTHQGSLQRFDLIAS